MVRTAWFSVFFSVSAIQFQQKCFAFLAPYENHPDSELNLDELTCDSPGRQLFVALKTCFFVIEMSKLWRRVSGMLIRPSSYFLLFFICANFDYRCEVSTQPLSTNLSTFFNQPLVWLLDSIYYADICLVICEFCTSCVDNLVYFVKPPLNLCWGLFCSKQIEILHMPEETLYQNSSELEQGYSLEVLCTSPTGPFLIMPKEPF